MSKARDLIASIRNVLADPSATRWSDEYLLSLLTDAQRDLSARCLLFKKQKTYSLLDGQATYRLPSDFVSLESGWASTPEGVDKPLEIANYKTKRIDGERVSNLPTHIIIGLQTRQDIMVYPKPSGVAEEPSTEAKFGRLTFIGDTNSAGIETEVTSSDTIIREHGKFGLIELTTPKSSFTILYYAQPAELKHLDMEIELEGDCEAALRYYVIAMALQSDMDGRNVQASQQYLNLYSIEVKRLQVERQSGFTQDVDSTLVIPYRTGFEI